MKTAMLGLLAETPIHAGSGRGMGVVDLPVAREAATDYPVLVGSSLKGVTQGQDGDGTGRRSERAFRHTRACRRPADIRRAPVAAPRAQPQRFVPLGNVPAPRRALSPGPLTGPVSSHVRKSLDVELPVRVGPTGDWRSLPRGAPVRHPATARSPDDSGDAPLNLSCSIERRETASPPRSPFSTTTTSRGSHATVSPSRLATLWRTRRRRARASGTRRHCLRIRSCMRWWRAEAGKHSIR